VLIVLMMGLMWRAARMCEERPEVALSSAETGAIARPGGWIFRLLAMGGVILPIVLAVGAFAYYLQWQRERDLMRTSRTPEAFANVRKEFYAHLVDGTIDEAYASTTADFKRRVSRDQLDDLARRYTAYADRNGYLPAALGIGGGGDGFSYDTEYRINQKKGKIVRVTITIRNERDSILFPEPPPLKVDDFKVEEKDPEGQ
jgi:hypothetical protein